MRSVLMRVEVTVVGVMVVLGLFIVPSAAAAVTGVGALLVEEGTDGQPPPNDPQPADPRRPPSENVDNALEYAEGATSRRRANDGGEDPLTGIGADGAGFDFSFLTAGIVGLAVTALGVSVYAGTRFTTREEVLANPVRVKIYAHVREKIGANLKQITDDLGLTTTNAIWHLRKLEDANLVHSRRFNGYKVFYPAEGGVAARRLSLSVTALTNDNAQSVFEYVIANPGTHQREIARALEVNHGTVRWHLRKLRRAELLTEVRRGKTSAYFATEMGVAALENVSKQATGAIRSAVATAAILGVFSPKS